MKIKIFEGTVKTALEKALIWCKENNGHIATMKEVWDLREQKKVCNQFYETSTIFYRGKIRKATLKELKNIEDFYRKGGRVLFLSSYYSGLNGGDLDNDGRYIGVAPEAQDKQNRYEAFK